MEYYLLLAKLQCLISSFHVFLKQFDMNFLDHQNSYNNDLTTFFHQKFHHYLPLIAMSVWPDHHNHLFFHLAICNKGNDCLSKKLGLLSQQFALTDFGCKSILAEHNRHLERRIGIFIVSTFLCLQRIKIV